MMSPQELQAVITSLPLNEQITLCDQLVESIDASVQLHDAIAERADFALMEKRLDDYESGLIPSRPWSEVRLKLMETYGIKD
jgi:putative addiction module component (TIGR02574 family)